MRLSVIYIGLVVCINASFCSIALGADPKSSGQQTVSQETPLVKDVAFDTNKDGKPDRWEYYDQGVIVRVEGDSNFDGKVDQWATFENGKIVKGEEDSDFDGKPDRWIRY